MKKMIFATAMVLAITGGAAMAQSGGGGGSGEGGGGDGGGMGGGTVAGGVDHNSGEPTGIRERPGTVTGVGGIRPSADGNATGDTTSHIKTSSAVP